MYDEESTLQVSSPQAVLASSNSTLSWLPILHALVRVSFHTVKMCHGERSESLSFPICSSSGNNHSTSYVGCRQPHDSEKIPNARIQSRSQDRVDLLVPIIGPLGSLSDRREMQGAVTPHNLSTKHQAHGLI